jgi:hypothetical protein
MENFPSILPAEEGKNMARQASSKGDDPAVQQAGGLLLDTPREDGSWFAVSKQATGREHVISSYGGAAWAAVGLERRLPDATDDKKAGQAEPGFTSLFNGKDLDGHEADG